jgi:hypothetical protein
MFDESLYAEMRARPEYQAKRQADAPSYAWDTLIEQFIRLGDPAIVAPHVSQSTAQTEEALRVIASESRFHRRLLVRELIDVVRKAEEKPGLRWARTVTSTQDLERVYVFLIFSKPPGESYEAYRTHRIAVLHAYCRCAKLKFPEASTFVGIATDHPIKDYPGGSEDLFIYRCSEFTEEERLETERYRNELGILPDSLEAQHKHDDEFPSGQALEPDSFEANSANNGARDENRRRKHKRNVAKASRRRNRRKK